MYLDNETILFKSSRSASDQERVKSGEELTSFYTMSLNGGEAKKYFEIPLFVSAIEKISAEEFLILASYNKDFSIVGREDKKEDLLKAREEEKDYEVFTKIPFCHNGSGYAANAISRLYIFGKYGTIDYDDLMKFTDIVLEKYPAIDKARVGVTGGSYGGFMTNWIIGHTNRFACAATQRSISNWISFYGTSDIGMFFTEDQIHGNIFENPEKLWEDSPLKYAKNIQTPTLFIHSDEDYRCPLEQGLQLYTAMVDKGIEARFVLFHGENHELSRGGKPKHRVRRLEEITGWMERYLKR